jgi:hypothetical protein
VDDDEVAKRALVALVLVLLCFMIIVLGLALLDRMISARF